MDKTDRRNRIFFGLGTVGRDMFYTMVSMFLMVYLTEVLDLPDSIMWWMTGILTVMRVFDAVNDPFMGVIVDNTKGKYGKFKPWMLIGGVTGGIFMILMFTDLGLKGAAYIIFFAIVYLGWDILYGLNDIAYWSMLPSLSTDQKVREQMGSFARICANIGLFVCVVGIVPVTNMISVALGGNGTFYADGGTDDARVKGWFVFAIIIFVLMIGFQLVTVFGVKERSNHFRQEENTTIREMISVIFKNDQLMWLALSLSLFMIGYVTTTSFGVHFFKYAYGDENMYSIFAAILGVSQLTAIALFPALTKRMSRKKLYTISTILVVAGYVLFFFSPMNMLFIGAAGILIFVGQAIIQTLMLMFLADTIEYGQLKMGKRNESVTFSVQPFINKIGGAIANGVLGVTLIVSGINAAATPKDVTAQGITIMKSSMLILPLVVIVIGYVIYLLKFKIDEKMHADIVSQLKARGEINEP